MTLHDLLLRTRALVARHRVERELDEELSFHIERETQKHIAAGLSPAAARTRAIARFGPLPLAADQCRDARGIGLVEDLVRDIFYAVRSFRRAPLAALTIVATVALGLGLVTAVFVVYNLVVLRVDAVRNPGELFGVEMEELIGPGNEPDVVFTRPDYDAMRRETSVFVDAVARFLPNPTRIDGRVAGGALVSGNFFQMLGVQASLGRPLMPGDDDRSGGRPVIVLSHAGWRKLFAGDPAAIGRRVVINGAPYEIVGVMPDGFRGLGATPPDYWAPLALAGQFVEAFAGREEEIPIEVIGRLKPGTSPGAARAALATWASERNRHAGQTSQAHQLEVSLVPRRGTLPADAIQALLAFSPLFFAFGLILMIGCANVANLLLARGVSRQREIGVRLSLGASRRRIIRQLLTESLLMSLAAAAGGLIVSRLSIEGALYAAMTTMPPELGEFVNLLNLAGAAPDWRVLVFVVAGAIVSTAFFGLAPALQATRFDLVRTMRGDVTRDARPWRARHALIAVQVGASALLLICAAIFLRGAFAAATRDPGIRTSDTVRVSVASEPRRAALLEALRSHRLVTAIAASSPPARGVVESTVTPVRASVGQLAVSSDYFDVLGIPVVSGRAFTPAERTAEAGVVIVSETIARQLWPRGDGVGQLLRFDAPQSASPNSTLRSSRTLTVVGIVRDPGRDAGMSYLDTFRGVYLPGSPETAGSWLFLRVSGNPEQELGGLLERLTSIDPGLTNIITLRTLAGLQAYALQIGFWVAVVLGALALVLTVSGLFSVLSYIVEQQAKEIGVRIALGAATKNVVRLVLSQSLRPVCVGLLAGSGLAAALATILMATSNPAEVAGWVRVLDPLAYAASLVVIAASCALAVSVPALQAARIDPIATLRKD